MAYINPFSEEDENKKQLSESGEGGAFVGGTPAPSVSTGGVAVGGRGGGSKGFTNPGGVFKGESPY